MTYKKFKLISFSHDPALISVQKLSCAGVIHIKGHYCYLKVADDYIHYAFPLLAAHFQMKKPNYFTPPDDIGAHISVIYPEEQIFPAAQLQGQIHSFNIMGLIKAYYGSQIYYGFSIAAPALAHIRHQHALPAMPVFKGEKIFFHITVGVFKPDDYK